MDTLTLIQIAGFAFAGLGGIVATFSDTRTEDKQNPRKKQLTKAGKWALSLTGMGILLGLMGQVIANQVSQQQTTQVLTNLTAQASNNFQLLTNLEHQGFVANQTLGGVDEVLTRVEGNISGLVSRIYG